ncbi:MAG: SCO family protein [Bacteroidia bacterium]|nr:SCO family protein [Bacteroidia bacterium]
MNSSAFFSIGFSVVLGFTAWTAFSYLESTRDLPVYGNMVEDQPQSISEFILLNEDSIAFNSSTFLGKPFIANFFFASCPTVCPKMNGNFQYLLNEYQSQINGMSITVDPTSDTPSALSTYRKTRSFNNSNWKFLSGEKKMIYSLAIKEFMLVAAEIPADEIPFIHSDKIVLVDAEGYIRGYYSGLEESSIQDLHRDIKKLIKG